MHLERHAELRIFAIKAAQRARLALATKPALRAVEVEAGGAWRTYFDCTAVGVVVEVPLVAGVLHGSETGADHRIGRSAEIELVQIDRASGIDRAALGVSVFCYSRLGMHLVAREDDPARGDEAGGSAIGKHRASLCKRTVWAEVRGVALVA